jgi:hypothetical protein
VVAILSSGCAVAAPPPPSRPLATADVAACTALFADAGWGKPITKRETVVLDGVSIDVVQPGSSAFLGFGTLPGCTMFDRLPPGGQTLARQAAYGPGGAVLIAFSGATLSAVHRKPAPVKPVTDAEVLAAIFGEHRVETTSFSNGNTRISAKIPLSALPDSEITRAFRAALDAALARPFEAGDTREVDVWLFLPGAKLQYSLDAALAELGREKQDSARVTTAGDPVRLTVNRLGGPAGGFVVSVHRRAQ